MQYTTDPIVARLERLYSLKVEQMETASEATDSLKYQVLAAEAAALGAAIESRSTVKLAN
ncbi:MAG: hypothetical protein MI864_16785 [Pseudomonadales bacterium]|uniref:Uncharacterized protein n=1 Tax=Oleiphilus messinensis TaxID=141451 RepID=A0A1Y0I231_9GAMM|nr:hypothetical protein [Oleiphilus messinensis]ARU54527.1 hypothetical protein OLMES_0423 [Oleiphilus messinensis]MCG8612180.1 hypothetical protein [Pseudomonadales bacterium]